MKITMVTSNTNKAREVEVYFHGALEVVHVNIDIPEIRSDDVVLIAGSKAGFAFEQLHTPLIVDDTSFSIDALGGFPGPYAAYVLNTLGNAGILKLMEDKTNRTARFTTAIAYASDRGVRVFTGALPGQITHFPKGCEGFGYDPIFDIGGRTLAELPLEEKSRISHRAKALASFHTWFMEEGIS